MELEEKQSILKSVALLVRNFVPGLGFEVLPDADEDLLIYLSKEDLIETARNVFNFTDIPEMCKLLVDGEFFTLSKDGLQIIKPRPVQPRFNLDMDSCWEIYTAGQTQLKFN